MLRKENVNEFLARTVAEKVCIGLGPKDLRNAIKVARPSNSIDDDVLLSEF